MLVLLPYTLQMDHLNHEFVFRCCLNIHLYICVHHEDTILYICTKTFVHNNSCTHVHSKILFWNEYQIYMLAYLVRFEDHEMERSLEK